MDTDKDGWRTDKIDLLSLIMRYINDEKILRDTLTFCCFEFVPTNLFPNCLIQCLVPYPTVMHR